jgi:hypothetical protein
MGKVVVENRNSIRGKVVVYSPTRGEGSLKPNLC